MVEKSVRQWTQKSVTVTEVDRGSKWQVAVASYGGAVAAINITRDDATDIIQLLTEAMKSLPPEPKPTPSVLKDFGWPASPYYLGVKY